MFLFRGKSHDYHAVTFMVMPYNTVVHNTLFDFDNCWDFGCLALDPSMGR